MDKIITLENNEKWLVIATVDYKNNTYSYIVRVNDKEDDILNEYKIISSSSNEVKNEDLEEIKKLLMPIVKKNLNID